VRVRVRVRMRNEGKQLDPSKACQNRVGQERVTDWRGGGQAPCSLLQLVHLGTSLGYHGPGKQLPGRELQAAHHLQTRLIITTDD
jgi:hypothetical protein